ncbi:hypothetical protein P0Y43_03585 [Pseudomonas entomophila]|uniref:hypothetical protein n=1 Tax=Pseudomonas entomophila TaxID=312306 RepID=UPI0023D8AF6E|nr:hypothetical protein [Pseudomonas entomophila]MDF0729811.1 hypothetical protein [Pseudomonas entomophila]
MEQVTNCVPDLDYLEKDVITGEQRYHFSFAFPDQSRNCQAALSSGSIADPRGFVKDMLDFTPGGNFEGGARELAWLKAKWLNDEYRPVRSVRSLPFLGYDEDTNGNSFIEVKGRGIKTALATVKFERGEEFDPSWFRDFVDGTDMNGLGALEWPWRSGVVDHIPICATDRKPTGLIRS